MITNILTTLIALNCAPTNAAYVGYLDGQGDLQKVRVGALANPGGQKLYSFGVLSDVHCQAAGLSGDAEKQARVRNLKNAITYYRDCPVDLICITGDLGLDHNVADLALYTNTVAEVANHPPIYVTTGNHDVPTSDQGATTDLVMRVFSDMTDTTRFFTDETDYSYEITQTRNGTTDHLIFFGMKYWTSKGNKAFSEVDKSWLANKLYDYRHDRCFIFTHLFFPEAAGNYKNMYASHSQLGSDNLSFLQKLREKYPNNIWFSGHSHWLLEYQAKDGQYNANIDPTSDASGRKAWTVHVPSCGMPREDNGDDTSTLNSYLSQGLICDVYSDHVEIRGINFRKHGDSGYSNEQIARAIYCLRFDEPLPPSRPGTYVTAADVRLERGNVTWEVDDDDHTLAITFGTPPSSDSQSVIVGSGITDSIVVYNDGYSVSPRQVDDALKVLGVWNAGSGDGYHNDDGTTITASNLKSGGIRIECRSLYGGRGGTYPVTITFKNFGWAVQ